MKVLLLGKGGRENALAWKIKQSPLLEKLYLAPGNAGTKELGKNLSFNETDFEKLREFALKEQIDLTVVGPEVPLVSGISDYFAAKGLVVFGPTKRAAQLEGSKIFTKQVLQKASVPHPFYHEITSFAQGAELIQNQPGKIVLKADGLAAGKGVVVAENSKEAYNALQKMMQQKFSNSKDQRYFIEQYLTGEEVSLLALCDGENYLLLEPCRDHKKAYDNNQGPNTGGMGAYSPVKGLGEAKIKQWGQQIIAPVLKVMAEQNRPYRGLLYAGLMVNNDQPYVLEFNARFGDPETQALLPRIKSDLLPLLYQAAAADLSKAQLEWDHQASLCVVLAAGGYPLSYQKGLPIKGLDQLEDVLLFHAGTKFEQEQLLTNGGRVLNVVALAANLQLASAKCYREIKKINFPGVFYRRDLGGAH